MTAPARCCCDSHHDPALYIRFDQITYGRTAFFYILLLLPRHSLCCRCRHARERGSRRCSPIYQYHATARARFTLRRRSKHNVFQDSGHGQTHHIDGEASPDTSLFTHREPCFHNYHHHHHHNNGQAIDQKKKKRRKARERLHCSGPI